MRPIVYTGHLHLFPELANLKSSCTVHNYKIITNGASLFIRRINRLFNDTNVQYDDRIVTREISHLNCRTFFEMEYK